jgi:hypothetical protein
MPTTETSHDNERSQRSPPEDQGISRGKIIDFFAAREALRSEARSADRQRELQQQIRAAARRQARRIQLSDPWENVMLLLLLVAAVALGLLVISGFG